MSAIAVLKQKDTEAAIFQVWLDIIWDSMNLRGGQFQSWRYHNWVTHIPDLTPTEKFKLRQWINDEASS